MFAICHGIHGFLHIEAQRGGHGLQVGVVEFRIGGVKQFVRFPEYDIAFLRAGFEREMSGSFGARVESKRIALVDDPKFVPVFTRQGFDRRRRTNAKWALEIRKHDHGNGSRIFPAHRRAINRYFPNRRRVFRRPRWRWRCARSIRGFLIILRR